MLVTEKLETFSTRITIKGLDMILQLTISEFLEKIRHLRLEVNWFKNAEFWLSFDTETIIGYNFLESEEIFI